LLLIDVNKIQLINIAIHKKMSIFFIHFRQLFISVLQVLMIFLILWFSPFTLVAFSQRLLWWLRRACFDLSENGTVIFKLRCFIFYFWSLFIDLVLIIQRCCTSLEIYRLSFFCFINNLLAWIFYCLFIVSLASSWNLLKVTQFEFLLGK
jgi:hypothetical protein